MDHDHARDTRPWWRTRTGWTLLGFLAIAAFFFVANYTLSFISVFALRRKEPDTPRPFRVPGFPVTTAIALLGSIAFLVGTVVADRRTAIVSVVVLAASWPVYEGVRRVRGNA